MNIVEACFVVLVSALLIFGGASLKEAGCVRQNLILQKTGEHIPWWTALHYPENYFTDATVKIEKVRGR